MGSIDVLMEGASLLCIMKIIPCSDFDNTTVSTGVVSYLFHPTSEMKLKLLWFLSV
jgi:hypothetical protein